MNAAELVARMTAAVGEKDGAAAVIREMGKLRGQLDDVAEALSYLPGTGGNAHQAFFRSPNLSLLKVNFPGGRRTPPHNHGTWATILLLSGSEKNTVYTLDSNNQLQFEREEVLEPGSIIHLPADRAHVAECMGEAPAVGLHIYGANVLGIERLMWDPETLVPQALDWRLYEGLAQRSSAMTRAPLTS